MEIDGTKWISDVERTGEKNAVHIARLYERVEQVQSDILESRRESKERSDERLTAIMTRFDQAERISGRRIGVALSFAIACCSAIWFVVVEPLQDRLAILERRMYETDRDSAPDVRDS